MHRLIPNQGSREAAQGGFGDVNESLFFDHAAMVVFLSNFETATDPNST
jgi:hypothetical protein